MDHDGGFKCRSKKEILKSRWKNHGKVANENPAPKVNRDLVAPAFELLAGDLAVAMEVTNMAVALGESALISSKIRFQLF